MRSREESVDLTRAMNKVKENKCNFNGGNLLKWTL